MSRPTTTQLNVALQKHIAVSDERWIETIHRIKRIEHILIGTAGTIIVLLIGIIVRGL
tara:strand:+ start:213 stop:386 length:174 start_codon:yes stop_codon:yes gene_type:complete